ncbi:MAG: transposase, partial [Treponema sp.]|nr:transposase [Treponema sp.]
MNKDRLFFLDSTALSVCNNGNIPSHRVTKSFSSRGKTSKGW